MTKEEFQKKYKENYDEEMRSFRSSELRREQSYTDNVLAKIIYKIETANLDMCYKLEKEETKNLSDYYFEHKIEELKQRYDFLEINIVRNLVGLGFIGNRTVGGEVEKVEWKVKEEDCDYCEQRRNGMKNFVLTEKGKVLSTNGGKAIIEDGYAYLMEFPHAKIIKEKVIAESDSSAELELKARELNLKGE